VKNRRKSSRKRVIPARPKTVLNRYSRFSPGDFSAIEDNVNAFELIHNLANNAGNYAAAEAKARGLGTAYVQGDKLVKVYAKGEVVAITPRLNRASFYVKYKPATILHAAKK
jgi:hypothetical protein